MAFVTTTVALTAQYCVDKYHFLHRSLPPEQLGYKGQPTLGTDPRHSMQSQAVGTGSQAVGTGSQAPRAAGRLLRTFACIRP